MKTIDVFSQVDKDKLLHTIFKAENLEQNFEGFKDIAPHTENLQILFIRQNKGKKYIPHYHIENIRKINITNESWIILKGKVKVFLYDIDNTILHEDILCAGDCSITYCGAHNYEILEDDSRIIEAKNGPFLGVERDRVRI